MTEPVADDDLDYLYAAMRGKADPGGISQPLTERVVDFGSDVLGRFTTRAGTDVVVGLLLSHPTADGKGCSGGVMFDVPEAEGLKGARWTVHSLDPLHIEPSILCSCGFHGWIRGGLWVSA